MNVTAEPVYSFSHLWKVLTLFLIPIGGGIPGGVILARNYGIAWQVMTFLYFVSDVILACVFEPILYLIMTHGKNSKFVIRFKEAFNQMVEMTSKSYGNITGPFTLILIAFGVDPMTGRAMAVAAGHGFISGWMIAIAGDMIYFTLIMASTLWLDGIIGDGTSTVIIIFAVMMIIPMVIRRLRNRFMNQENR